MTGRVFAIVLMGAGVLGFGYVPAIAVEAAGATGQIEASGEVVGGQGSWAWPVPEPRVLKRPFDRPDHEYGAGHRGIDVAAGVGASVAAPAAGTVLFAGPVAGRSVVTVDHGGGIVTSYDPVVPAVTVGDAVTPGTVIGTLEAAEAMHCASGCLHLGVRVGGDYVDPLPFFGRPARSVLLPLGN
ncbi:peptidase M23-like protein [Labedella gwakjiensis]|uniref:M23 family metallopeptidase n=1 Tax=Labedella gwakjiensis TaxID=390269 RepID=A0A2P8H0N5_9MICO|nr:M23 family metallopeptidase [Labedella gwakjiensis]PSL39769.1 peptidase M23-like protein [Labedella gwakjiensis]RUQ85851.1 M23 family metallopeptidase [Labedella gwakjiensis]